MGSIGLDVGRQFAEAAAIEPGGEVHRLGRMSRIRASRYGRGRAEREGASLSTRIGHKRTLGLRRTRVPEPTAGRLLLLRALM